MFDIRAKSRQNSETSGFQTRDACLAIRAKTLSAEYPEKLNCCDI